MSLITEGELKITKAKTHLVSKFPFIAVLALGLRYRNAGEYGIQLPFPTMATDAIHIFWDENFVAKITVYELVGVVAHEVVHVMMLHILRRGNRDAMIWNMACDYIVNIIVLDMGFQLPADRLYEEKYRGKDGTKWTVELVYDDLIQQQKEKEKNRPQQGGQGKPQEGTGQPGSSQPGQDSKPSQEKPQGSDMPKENLWGTFMEPRKEDGTPLNEQEKTELGEQIKVKVLQAAAAAKSAGNLPGAFKGLLKALGQSNVNWQDYIQNWVSGHTPDDYTWKRPNRRMLGVYDMITPSIQFNGAGVGVLSIDTSGSVTTKELRKAVTEIVAMIETCNPEKLYIIQHDAKVQRVDVWERGDTFDKLELAGRGGTKIKPVFDYVGREIDEEVQWMICFTDMEVPDFPPLSEEPDFPVLWAATGSKRGHKFGTYLPIRPALEMAE